MAVSVHPGAAGDNLPPQNQEAEVSVLGAILINERVFDRVVIDAKLQPDDFYRDRHSLIFQAMRRLKEKASPEPIDVLTVCEELQRAGDLDAAGGSSYVHSLPTLVPATANAPHYARIVKEHALLRRLLHASIEIRERVLSFSGDPQELVDQAEQTLFRVAHEDRTGDVRAIGDVLHDELDKLEKVSREGVELTGTPSGFRDLDALTGGFQPGNLIVLAARPAMGKSAMVVNIAENAAVDKRRAVALFSLEMSEAELAQRFLASRAKLDGDDLRKGRVKADRWPKVLKAAEKFAAAPLYVDDSSDLGIHELRAKARRLQSRHDLGLVIVDYLQLMRPEDGSVSRVEQIGHMSRGLKILARELDVPVIAVSQLSRAVESRPDKRPLLSDLRESGCLTGDARVYLPQTGEHVSIADLVGRSGFQVLAVDTDTWRVESRKVTRAFSTGRKPVHRMTTALGKQIRATGNHRFLTVAGWRRLDELEPGMHVALPRALPGPSERTMTDDELALLGHLTGDGCTLPRHAIQYTTNELQLAELVASLATRVFKESIAPRVKRERDWYQVYLASSGHLTHRRRNPVAEWLRSLGAFGYRAHEKRVPSQVFSQHAGGIALFLRHLWATDGSVWLGKGDRPNPSIYYATGSSGLAEDVQALLLRLGITARRYPVTQQGGRTQHHVRVSGAGDMRGFLGAVGGLGDRRERHATAISKLLNGRAANTNRDVIPGSTWRTMVVPAMEHAGVTARALQSGLGMSYCGSTLYRSNMSRERAARVAEVVDSPELRSLAAGDVYWDQVTAIEDGGVEEVYDLTVEGLHNFVADGIVVHNSIEQDADVVTFIYRDEYYNKESERPGEADIIVAKHRNGPVGDVVLTFMPRYPKFANLYRDYGAEGAAVAGNGGDPVP